MDRPRFTIEDAFAIGPVDVKLSPDGTKVATSSVDNSMRIFSLQTEDEESKEGQSGQGTASQILESPGDVSEAWKIDFSADGNQLLTGQLNLHTLTMSTDGASGET